MLQNGEIIYLSKGLPKNAVNHGEEYRSGIWKRQVAELYVDFQQIEGDDVANPDYHGGPDRVVCLYPYEHYAHWEKVFGKALTNTAFGENITVAHMREDQVCIGDVFQIGEAELQISQGRYPCATINKRNNNHLLLKKVIESGFTGYFFRVIKRGRISTNSQIKKLFSHPKQVTVSYVHHLYFNDPRPTIEAIQRILDIEELAPPWRGSLLDLIKKHDHSKGID